MSRREALKFIAAMNDGFIDNFGCTDWRLASLSELRGLSRSPVIPGDLNALDRYLAAVSYLGKVNSPSGATRFAAKVNAGGDSIYTWPVRFAHGVSSDVSDAAIMASNSIFLKKNVNVTGDVIVSAASPGPTLDPGVELSIDKDGLVDGNAEADSIVLDKKVTITGDAFVNDLTGKGTVDGDVFAFVSSSLPPFQPAVIRPEPPIPGPGLGEDVDVGGGETETLAAGDYGDITIAQGGTLVFSGGVFNVRSISAAGGCPYPCSSVLFSAPSDVRIADQFDAGSNSCIGPGSDSNDCPAQGSMPASGSDSIIYVTGTNGGDGTPGAQPSAFTVGQNSNVGANIYAANGTVQLDKNAIVKGALLGRDVKIDKDGEVAVDSFFANRPPVADPQDVLTDGDNPLVITLEGSDPEDSDLSFSIEVPPAEGILGAISPITPDPVDQCSQSGETCNVDSDCPGFAEGETCDTVQPPITQANVTYTPTAANCVTDPESGQITCPEDFFTFGVKDVSEALGTAIVSVNGGTDEIPDDPGTGVDAVTANDLERDASVNEFQVITLSAAAPDTVASLLFRVETLPTGTLQDSDGSPVVAGVDLPSPVVTYQAPGTAGSDSFTFSAHDFLTPPPPCGPPSCDTGTVNIDVGNLPELAPAQSVGTDLNTPVEITLRANSGGESGMGPLSAGGESLQAVSASALEITYGDNGPPSSRMRLATTPLGVDAGWFQFGWCDIVTSPDCNDLIDLVNEVEVIESPFDFTITEASCLRVTDTLAKGDHFRVDNVVGVNADWTDFTSEVEQSTVGTTGDPDVAFGDLEYSHGEFDLSDGTYSIRLTTIPPDSFAFGTAGYIRVDSGPCVDILWTVTSLPSTGAGTLTNLDNSAVLINDTYLAEPTVVFTPASNFDGSTSFTYQVEQGATIGIGVVDTAIIDILVSETDPCILVGREPGCTTPGS